VKIAIVADVHGNFEAFGQSHDYDELWVLGDLVNYGPEPKEVGDFVRAKSSVVVRGIQLPAAFQLANLSSTQLDAR
jgi:protein phosphatase